MFLLIANLLAFGGFYMVYNSTTISFIPEGDNLQLPHPLPDELVELIARRFRALAEPMRIRLLDQLRDGEATVGELSDLVGASQQNVSKHLAVLADNGILGRRKDGNHVYYRIVDEGVLTLCEDVCGSLREQLRTLSALVDLGAA
jgi:ArsR family transcriptional regulator